jgi:hypothetical protein
LGMFACSMTAFPVASLPSDSLLSIVWDPSVSQDSRRSGWQQKTPEPKGVAGPQE